MVPTAMVHQSAVRHGDREFLESPMEDPHAGLVAEDATGV